MVDLQDLIYMSIYSITRAKNTLMREIIRRMNRVREIEHVALILRTAKNIILRLQMIENPTPEQIKQARIDAGLTQTQAASTIYKNIRTWQQWEKGDREMDVAFFELFKIKTSMLNARS